MSGELSWTDDEYDALIEQLLKKDEEGAIFLRDISSPPGTRKTYSVMRFLLRGVGRRYRSAGAIASFPTHQNQATALKYIIKIVFEEFRRPPTYVLDYAGVEHYCLLRNPDLLAKLLENYKPRGDSKYVDAAQSMLASSEFYEVLAKKNMFESVEAVLMKLADYLDKGDKNGYRQYVDELIERRGQNRVCRDVCPIGIMAQRYRHQIRERLATPKIITWRKELVKEVAKELNKATGVPEERVEKWANKHIVVANPSRALKYLGAKANGVIPDPTVFLCPRLLLITKLVKTKTGKSEGTFLAVESPIILTPHSGLSFVMSTISRELELLGIDKEYILYVDEYDSLALRPVEWPVLSLDAVRAELSLARMILDAGVGGWVGNVKVDRYLHAYARYVDEVLSGVLKVVEDSVAGRTYSPLANVFVEGALSALSDDVLSAGQERVAYYPLGPRVVHVRHVLRDFDLVRKILNPLLSLNDLSGDEDWELKVREAVVTFRMLLSRQRYLGLVPYVIRTTSGRTIMTRRVAKSATDVLAVLREYLSNILELPLFVVVYGSEVNPDGTMELMLASLDARLLRLLAWSRSAIFTSATPVPWTYVISGTHAVLGETPFSTVAKSGAVSIISFDSEGFRKVWHAGYEALRITGLIPRYTPEFASSLRSAVETGSDVGQADNIVEATGLVIEQISPLTEMVRSYVKLLTVSEDPQLLPVATLLTGQPGEAALSVAASLLYPYVRDITALYNSGRSVLVLAQNRQIAKVLAKVFGGTPCLGAKCGVSEEHASHYLAKGRIAITWYRSRAARGIDLPLDIDAVVAFSPYPRPRFMVNFIDVEVPTGASKLAIAYTVRAYNTHELLPAVKTLLPLDIAAGVSELVQAVGRATRSVMKTGRTANVIIPSFIGSRVAQLAPVWFALAMSGQAPEQAGTG